MTLKHYATASVYLLLLCVVLRVFASLLRLPESVVHALLIAQALLSLSTGFLALRGYSVRKQEMLRASLLLGIKQELCIIDDVLGKAIKDCELAQEFDLSDRATAEQLLGGLPDDLRVAGALAKATRLQLSWLARQRYK